MQDNLVLCAGSLGAATWTRLCTCVMDREEVLIWGEEPETMWVPKRVMQCITMLCVLWEVTILEWLVPQRTETFKRVLHANKVCPSIKPVRTWPAPGQQIPRILSKGGGHVHTWLFWDKRLQAGSACPHSAYELGSSHFDLSLLLIYFYSYVFCWLPSGRTPKSHTCYLNFVSINTPHISPSAASL